MHLIDRIFISVGKMFRSTFLTFVNARDQSPHSDLLERTKNMFKKVALFAFLGSASAVKCVFFLLLLCSLSLSLNFHFSDTLLTRPSFSSILPGENIFLCTDDDDALKHTGSAKTSRTLCTRNRNR